MTPRPFERPATILLPETPGLPSGASLEGLWLPARSQAISPRDLELASMAASTATSAFGIAGDYRGGAIVAAPHPLMGGSMDSPVATELGLAASDAAMCRCDSGCGVARARQAQAGRRRCGSEIKPRLR
jgi:hypothetical protein